MSVSSKNFLSEVIFVIDSKIPVLVPRVKNPCLGLSIGSI